MDLYDFFFIDENQFCFLVVGEMENAVYRSKTMFMQPGDTLIIYTDGVTEAMDRE